MIKILTKAVTVDKGWPLHCKGQGKIIIFRDSVTYQKSQDLV